VRNVRIKRSLLTGFALVLPIALGLVAEKALEIHGLWALILVLVAGGVGGAASYGVDRRMDGPRA
jgi:hypothetical protein